MSITSDAFRDWAAAFKNRRAYQGHKAESEEEGNNGILVSSTLAKLELKPGVSTPDLLTANLLYACYQAELVKVLKSDPADARREKFRSGHKALSPIFSQKQANLV